MHGPWKATVLCLLNHEVKLIRILSSCKTFFPLVTAFEKVGNVAVVGWRGLERWMVVHEASKGKLIMKRRTVMMTGKGETALI